MWNFATRRAMKKKNYCKQFPKTRTALVNLVLYQFLLVATPFLLVRNFLQQAIGTFSQWSFDLAGKPIPYTVAFVCVTLIVVLILNLKKFRIKTALIFLSALLLWRLGQLVTDYYFNHDFFELQHNWHYLAYGILAWVSYLYHQAKGYSHIRYIWQTVAMGQIISIFDEVAQIFISGRVFDVCDIGKDLWGNVIGMIVITAAVSHKLNFSFKLLHKKPADNFSNPYSSLFILALYAFLFLSIGSLITETRYLGQVILWSWGSFLAIILCLYFTLYKWGRLIIATMIVAGLLWGVVTWQRHDQAVIQKQPGLLEWRGLPVPYFDLMIKPSGSIKLVDKKAYFNKKDKMNRIYGLCEEILLIGSGTNGTGGKGFPKKESHFVFNPVTGKPLQILIYPNLQACKIYNKLTAQGKKLLFIIHNS